MNLFQIIKSTQPGVLIIIDNYNKINNNNNNYNYYYYYYYN